MVGQVGKILANRRRCR